MKYQNYWRKQLDPLFILASWAWSSKLICEHGIHWAVPKPTIWCHLSASLPPCRETHDGLKSNIFPINTKCRATQFQGLCHITKWWCILIQAEDKIMSFWFFISMKFLPHTLRGDFPLQIATCRMANYTLSTPYHTQVQYPFLQSYSIPSCHKSNLSG